MDIAARSSRLAEAGCADGMQDREDSETPVRGLEQLLDEVEAVSNAPAEAGSVSLGDIVGRLGSRSFAPLLLLAGIVMLAPIIGDIPGVPMLLGAVVILVAGQLLLRRDHVWLPRWLLERSVAADKVRKTVGWLRRPARFVDRWSGPRQTWLVHHAGASVIAVACILVASATPIMEVIPFSANLAGVAITALGLALLAEDGVIALVAIAFCIAAIVLVVMAFV